MKQTELGKVTAELTELLLIVTGWSRQSLGRWRQNWQSYCWLWQDEEDRAWEGDGRTDRAIVDCDRMKVHWGWSRQSSRRWRQNWQSYCWLWQDEGALRLKQTELEKVMAELTELLLIVTGWRCIEVEADRAWEGDGRTDSAIVDCDRMKMHWGWSRQSSRRWRQNWQSYCWLWQDEGALRLKQTELEKVTAELTELLLIVTGWRCIEVEADRAWEGDGRTDRAIVDCDRMKVHWGWSRQSLGGWRQNWQSYCWLWQDEADRAWEGDGRTNRAIVDCDRMKVHWGWSRQSLGRWRQNWQSYCWLWQDEADRAWEGDGRTDRAIVDCDRMKVHWGWSRQSLRGWRQNWQSYCWLWQDEGALRLKQTELEKVTAELTELLLIVTGWRCIEVEADRAWEGDGRTDRAIVDCDRMKVHWGWSRQSLRRWRQNWQSYCWLWQDEADRAWEGDGRTNRAIVDCDRMKMHWGWSRQSLRRWRQNWQSYCWLWQDEADRAWEGDGRTNRAIVDCDRMKMHWGWSRQSLGRWRQNWQSYCWLWQDEGALRLKQTELEKVTAELTELLLIVTGWSRQSLGMWRQN